ncbi:2,3-dihydro-2,3-dihydroxybenzoate dehydrogenase [Marinomonas sp.]|uniref:2,3-dihydro-2,3-dihydroxybenzoate dehydrogenase n=1 Tax=Marinomonas sp. TaxID=1904862 RepID=UPI003F99ACA1
MSEGKMDFSGKTVWVTGAGQGIGYETAQLFSRLGADVVGFDLVFPKSEYPFSCEVLDISKREEVRRVTASVLMRSPNIDVLVNCAGVLRLGNIEDLHAEDWRTCLNTNVTGPFYLMQRVIPFFKQQKSGSIVTVSSNAARTPRMQMAAYAASKAALSSLNHCAGLELAEYGVRCNLVSPGSTNTAMQQSMWSSPESEQNTIQGFPEQYKLGIPLGKIAQPIDVANTVVFLASDLAGHITMQDVVVDGGATLTS